MHICFLTNEYPKKGVAHGGIGTFVQSFGQQLVKHGHQVSVVGTNDTITKSYEEDAGVKVYRTKRYKIKGLAALLNSKAINTQLHKIHKENPIHLIESNEGGLAFIKKIPGVQYVIRMHGGHHFFTIFENRPREPKKVWIEKKSFTKADHLIAVSSYVAEITLKELGIVEIPVKVIFNPINTEKFEQVDYAKATPYSLLFVGTVCEKKGVRQLVKALPLVKEKFPAVSLKILGRDWLFPNGDSYIDYLKAEISSEVKDHISFEGVVPNAEVPSFIENAQICVYPSHMEAMPLAWLEVLSMGKQFVGSRIGPGFEAVLDGETGLLCDPHEPKDIAHKICWMFENEEKAIAMGKNARKDMLLRFELHNLVQKNIAHFEKLISNV